MTVNQYLAVPRNSTCHNLLYSLPLLPGTKALFGLGANFCLKSRSSSINIEATIERYTNDVRRTFYWKNKEPSLLSQSDDTYNPKLYFKSEHLFPSASKSIELALKRFSADLRVLHKQFTSVWNHPNLTPRKYHILTAYKLNDLYIAVEADNNLGLCVLERDY